MRELTMEELELVAGGEGSDIIVTGNPGDWGDWGGGDFGDSGGGIGGDSSPPPPPPPPPPPTFQGKDCANNSLQSATNSAGDTNSHEHLGIVYQDASGYHTSPLFTGDSTGVHIDQVTQWMSANNVPFSSVVSLFHNHDSNEYATSADEAAVNRYLSTNDWKTADYFVNNGANAANFTMALEDTDHVMRDFSYGDEAQLSKLTDQQKIDGSHLPGKAPSC